MTLTTINLAAASTPLSRATAADTSRYNVKALCMHATAILPPKDPARRAAALANYGVFLKTFFPHGFPPGLAEGPPDGHY